MRALEVVHIKKKQNSANKGAKWHRILCPFADVFFSGSRSLGTRHLFDFTVVFSENPAPHPDF